MTLMHVGPAFVLIVNGIEVKPCACATKPKPHWAIADIQDALARVPAPADCITIGRALPGIPDGMACPWCGGYVRGHQWIGSKDCSITSTVEFVAHNGGWEHG